MEQARAGRVYEEDSLDAVQKTFDIHPPQTGTQCVNEMDNVLSVMDDYDPVAFCELAEILLGVVKYDDETDRFEP